MGFEPTSPSGDQNTRHQSNGEGFSPWVWRLRPLGHPDNTCYHTPWRLVKDINNSGARGTPWVNKSGNLSIREILIVASAYARPYRLWGRGRRALRQPDRGGECHLFLAGNRAMPLGNRWTQRQNECACSAFSRASGHFLVSGYDQKAIITEKIPVLCSL